MADQDKKTSQFAAIEEQMLELWDKEKTFEKSLEQRRGGENFSFYDGPPFANGLPHFGHTLVTSIKDSLGRYKTMQGYYVDRRNGWDCHGLPVEFAIEKQLGVSGKKQILEIGLEKFNQACRDSVFTYKADWETFFKRVGRWTDTERAYATIDTSYTESVWWVLSQINDKGLLYRGYKSMPYCPRCETPLSNFEVNEGYRDDVPDPSLYVKFKLKDQDTYLLGWTTTPWSLPGNAAVAVNPNEQYVYAELTDEDGKKVTLVLAKKRLSVLGEGGYEVTKEVSADELVGLEYEPLFAVEGVVGREGAENLYKVWASTIVSVEDGSGVLHVAPAFGEDDLNLGQEHNVPVLSTTDPSGHITSGIGLLEVEGLFFKEADQPIIEYLTKSGHVFAAETFTHTYPFCYRCESPLLYYAISTWFIKVSAIKEQLLASGEEIEWIPDHIKHGRFGKWLEGARDWAVSRNRYWGAPMPIWVNVKDENDYIVVDSVAKLKELAGPDIKVDDLHRPFIDEITFEKDGKTYKRVEEVLDCWFESGSMPVAQQHYPFENKEVFDVSFPADYIGEGLDQTRLWFYVLHVISTILFDKPAYKHVLVNGMIMAADGQKLSKRLKNYPPVEDVFANEGADTLRLYLLSNNQAVSADYMRFNRDQMKDLNRNVLGTLQNSFRFFKMYADIDGWKPESTEQPESTNVLDQWILARLNETIVEVTSAADAYKLAHAINPIFLLIDDMSNWYIRRSRRRFWKSEDDSDKNQAYATLWYVMMRVCQLLAPWAPFLSDHLWRELVKGTDLPSSVHLSDWPKVEESNQEVLVSMFIARNVINNGLAQRAAEKIKVRQPLSQLTYWADIKLSDQFEEIIADEVNVQNVDYEESRSNRSRPFSQAVLDTGLAIGATGLNINNGGAELNTDLTPELRQEGLMRDIVRHVQNARKEAGLEVDDRITLHISSADKDIAEAVKTFEDTIKAETLATTLSDAELEHTSAAKIDGVELTISIQKA